MGKTLQISRPDYQTMLAQLQAAYPLEACGLMAGRDRRVERLYPIDNILSSPTAYEMDPHQQLQAMLTIEEAGWDLIAIYHSHPHGPETPSATDVDRAYYPDTVYVIVSLSQRHRPSVRAFTIVNGQIDEIPLTIV